MARNFDAYDEALRVLSEPGVCLVLEGPAGAGKTRLANKLTRGLEPVYEVSMRKLTVDGFAPWSGIAPKVVIVEHDAAVPELFPDAFDFCKLVATNQVIQMHKKGEPSTWIPSPKLIVTTQDASVFVGSRRFKIVKV